MNSDKTHRGNKGLRLTATSGTLGKTSGTCKGARAFIGAMTNGELAELLF